MSAAHATFVTHSPDETEALGEQLGRLLKPGDCVCLSGNLGVGKTCLVRGVARGWGAIERPSSPTFTLINQYHRADGARLFHVDCYRMSGIADAVSSGLEDALDQGGVTLIEWAERIRELLPPDAIWVGLEDQGETRRAIQLSATGDQVSNRLAAFYALMKS